MDKEKLSRHERHVQKTRKEMEDMDEFEKFMAMSWGNAEGDCDCVSIYFRIFAVNRSIFMAIARSRHH